MELQAAAADRLTEQRRDEEDAGRRPHGVELDRQARTGVEAGREAAGQLGEVLVEAVLRLRIARIDGIDLYEGGREQRLHLTHGGDEALTLTLREGIEQRAGERVAPGVEQRPLRPSLRRQAGGPDPAVVGTDADADQPVRLE